jgi:hypothetical protein
MSAKAQLTIKYKSANFCDIKSGGFDEVSVDKILMIAVLQIEGCLVAVVRAGGDA